MGVLKRDKILYEGDTELEHYQIIDMVYEGRYARVLFSGNRSAAFSGLPLDGGQELLFDYIQRFYELVATIRPKSLLLVGGGVYTLPAALIHSIDDIEIDVIEIDAGLDKLAREYFGWDDNPRVRIFHEGGKAFMQRTERSYDMILIDAFSNLKIPASLAANNTATVVKNRLNKNGIVAMNIISAYHGRRSDIISHFYAMYDKNFRRTQVYPADTSTSLWTPQNFILIAQKDNLADSYGLRFGKLDPPDYPRKVDNIII